MIIILVNGPPSAGKDTVGLLLEQQFSSDIRLEKFAMPLKQAVRTAFCIPFDKWRDEIDIMPNKDLPHSALLGKTPRDVQISFSEDWLKPFLGKDVFGKLAVKRLQAMPAREAVVITDSGFREEAACLVNAYGADKVFLWRIHREGCTFAKDSRDYIDLSDLGVRTLNIVNDLSMNDLRGYIGGLYEACTLPRELKADNMPETDAEWHERRDLAIREALARRNQFRKEAI